jgi:hypothetical protein
MPPRAITAGAAAGILYTQLNKETSMRAVTVVLVTLARANRCPAGRAASHGRQSAPVLGGSTRAVTAAAEGGL